MPFRTSSNNNRNEIKILKEEAQAIKNRSKLLKKDHNFIKNGKTALQILIEEAHTIRNNSKVLIEQTNNIKKASNIIKNNKKYLKKRHGSLEKIKKSIICLQKIIY